MARDKLTKTTADKAKHGQRDAFISDSDLPGFGLKITPAGRKVYVLQYRFLGQLRRRAIGRRGEHLTPAQARERAGRLRRSLPIAASSNAMSSRSSDAARSRA
jgi:hypothetical protein